MKKYTSLMNGADITANVADGKTEVFAIESEAKRYAIRERRYSYPAIELDEETKVETRVFCVPK
jgi:hypothetical protein